VDGGEYVLTDLGEKHASEHGAPVPIFKDFKHPTGYDPGVEEGLTYVKYATIDMGIPDEGTYKTTVGKWAIQIIKGEVGTLDGLKKMREELVSLGITQK
jgi:putative aldouronate transport system substrate-binding protein